MTIPGDLNGDGFDEVVIGAWKFPDYEHPTGKVYIYSYKNICSVFNPVIEKQIKIIRNYPNPFNSTINIQFQLLINLKINIDIYNSIGQHIVTLLSEYRNSGTHTVSWNGKDKFGKCVNSGIYFYILTCTSEKQYEAGKLALIK